MRVRFSEASMCRLGERPYLIERHSLASPMDSAGSGSVHVRTQPGNFTSSILHFESHCD